MRCCRNTLSEHPNPSACANRKKSLGPLFVLSGHPNSAFKCTADMTRKKTTNATMSDVQTQHTAPKTAAGYSPEATVCESSAFVGGDKWPNRPVQQTMPRPL